MNIFTVTNDVREILMRSEEIQQLIGTKIFPVIAPENTVGDFICYQRDGYKGVQSKFGLAMQEPLVFVNVVSEDYDRSQQIASAVCDVLEGSHREMRIRITLEDSSEDYEDDKYIQIMLFSISNQ